jgi:methionyl-tRNA formyltransferase
MTPWPGAVCETPRGLLKLLRARAVTAEEGQPGEIVRADADGLVVAARPGAIEVLECQRPGRQVTSGIDYVRGLHEPIAGERWTRVAGAAP